MSSLKFIIKYVISLKIFVLDETLFFRLRIKFFQLKVFPTSLDLVLKINRFSLNFQHLILITIFILAYFRWQPKLQQSESTWEQLTRASAFSNMEKLRSSPTIRETARHHLTLLSPTPSVSSEMPLRTRSQWTQPTPFSVSLTYDSCSTMAKYF